MEVYAHSEVSRMERGERGGGGVHSVHFNCLSRNWDKAEFIDNTPQSLASNCDYTPKCLDVGSGSSVLKRVFMPIPTNRELDPTLMAELPCQVAPTTDSGRCTIAENNSSYSSSRNINVKKASAVVRTDSLMETTNRRNNELDATVMDNPLICTALSSSKATNSPNRKEHEVKMYLTAYVYPILMDAIVHLLCRGAGNIKQVLHNYLIEKKEGLRGLGTDQKEVNNVMDKAFMDRQIVPVLTKLVHAAIIQRSSNPTELFLDELKHMIDEEEEGLGEDDGPVTSVRDNKTFTPSVRRKLSEALSYSHENFKKFEVIGRNSSSTLERYKSEQVQQAYVRAENKDDKTPLLPSPGYVDEAKPINSAMQITTIRERIVCILLLGLDGAGKTTLSRVIHGELNPKTVPTVGFKPSRLNLGETEQTNLEVGKLLIHDIGGGPKIRGIWENYYHDCHAVIFCVDSSDESRWKEASTLFGNCSTHKYLRDKPILVVCTKADAGVSVNENRASEELALTTYVGGSSVVCCSLLGGGGIRSDNDEMEESIAPDSHLQEGLTWLLSKVVVQWDVLNKRVAADMDEVEKKFCLERQKKKIAVLGQVILKAFSTETSSNADSLPEDVFEETDGLDFLAMEIGQNGGRACLPSEAIEAAKLVGYQKLALQMVGNMNVPVNKKTSPMEWPIILDLLRTIRKDVGLQNVSPTAHDEKFPNPNDEEEETELDDNQFTSVPTQ